MKRVGQLVGMALVVASARHVSAQVPAPAEGAFPEQPAPAVPATEPHAAPAPPAPAPAAQPPPPAPAPAPAAQSPAPPPLPPTADAAPAPPARPGKAFVSLALGGGYFHASSGDEEDIRTFSGGTFAGQMVLASRIGKSRTVAVGGTYLRDQVLGLSSKDELQDGDEPQLEDIAFGLWMLGFFTDVSFQQAPGLHLQTILGVGGLSVDGAGRDTDTPSGLAFNLGVGYDLSVGKHLALGGLLRATYARLDVSEVNGTTVSTLVPSLLLTATTR